ncbi:MAG: tRNA uridine-5-carboxymethylaminomethyl(34) synthesis GTPase MnmE [Eubacteriales bacterium]|nr:tRNA uridine-5-carboxymethylaminomethyl(34) synthesis GTPase MnmE [Eubacteriales bacterium]
MSKTIAAIATGPAAGPIGIIRVSGPQTLAIVDKIFTPRGGAPLSEQPNRLLTYGALHARDGRVIDHCLCCAMHAPHSYTGEDMAEIQCHGSPAILSETLAALFAGGAVQAGPGEFTQRAFLHGKMDLSGAEAVNDIITAATTQAAENAAAQMEGAVGSRIREIRQRLLDLVAEFLAVVDYPDEEIDSHLFDNACELLHNATRDLYDLAETYERGRILREGIPCAILGRPNAGKSSLLNALAGVDRAIVTNVPGTTRDVIEETIRIGAVVLRLYDTAGLRDTQDPVEKIGIDRAMKQAQASALILAVFDSSDNISDDDLMVIARTHGKRTIAVLNKSDLPSELEVCSIRKYFEYVVSVSAKTGEGLQELYDLIPQVVGMDGMSFDGSVITNARQAAALVRAAERCEEAFVAAQLGMTPDAVVMDAEGAIAALGEITGQAVRDDIVATIFDKFCVGK